MTNIIDKRFTMKDGSVVNRQKFIKRYKDNIKEALRKAVGEGSIKDFKFKDQKVKIKAQGDLDLPSFEYDPEEGVHQGISVGNKTYRKGDTVDKPPTGRGGGTKGSKDGGGQDSFEFVLTQKEFADLFFEDLALPEMIKKRFTGDNYEIQRAGYSSTGGPSSLSIKQTIIRAFMRRFALKKKADKDGEKLVVDKDQIVIKKKRINFLEDVDLRYNYRDKVDVPSTKAVMFCLMDVSGSMGETEKDMAKRFFILLNMFLNRNYDIVDVVFVRHAEWADECSEEEFFYGRESGGTVISTGYEKILDIIKQRYNPEVWNVYVSQATDGDNFDYDNSNMSGLLANRLLPLVQYFSYVEVTPNRRTGYRSNIYELLEKVSQQTKNLAVRAVQSYSDIFEVFRSLFNKEKQ
jgi:uncharacterized protein